MASREAAVVLGSSDIFEMPSPLLRISNVVAYLLFIIVNILANTGAFGPTNADISADYDTPLTPSGWAFSIWGLIFLLQGAGTLYQALPYGYHEGGGKRAFVNTIGYMWQLGWVLEVAWQLTFPKQTQASTYLCAGLLLSAVSVFWVLLVRLNPFTSPTKFPWSLLLVLLFLLPTSVNAAWLTVASSLSLLIVPIAQGIPYDMLIAPAVMLAIAIAAVTCWWVWFTKDIGYGLTIMWAFMAIYGNYSKPRVVRYLSLTVTVLVGLLVMLTLTRRRQRTRYLAPQGGMAAGTVQLMPEEDEESLLLQK